MEMNYLPNYKSKKLYEENIEKCLHELGSGNNLLASNLYPYNKKEKIDFDVIKI